MSFCSPDSYSKCHWHNGRPPLASFDHPCCMREVLVWILGGRRGALDNRQSSHPFLEESALTGNLKFTFKWFISFNSFTEAVHSLKCVRKTRVRIFLYQHLRHISGRETRPHPHLIASSSRSITLMYCLPHLHSQAFRRTIQMVRKLLTTYMYGKKSCSNYSTSRINTYQSFLNLIRRNVHNYSNLQQQAIHFFSVRVGHFW